MCEVRYYMPLMATQRRSYKPLPLHLVVRRAPKGLGLGLYAGEDIPRGACIIEYTGRVISKEEETTSRSRYLFTVSRNKTIDGAARSNTARYINHSCRPNAEVEIYKGRIYIFALRGIKTGEAITYDYGKEYCDEYFAKEGCKCDSCAAKSNAISAKAR